MVGLEVLEYKDALNDDLRKRGHWIVAYVESSMAWPVRVQKIVYLGQTYWIIPVTKDAYPGIAVRNAGGNDNEIRERILRFLSVLSWLERKGAVLVSFGGGGSPFAYKRNSNTGLIIRDRFDLRYLPEVTDDKAQLALALMREGRGLSHIAYSFLSFYRVLEVAVGKGRVIKDWVTEALQRLPKGRGNEALQKLIESGVTDVPDHLYVSGRCAIAHAGGDPIIDPDNPTDTRRLYQELPLIETLAEIAIEERLGVQTSVSVFREHLYELAGFKRILGNQLVANILEGNEILGGTKLDIPAISFQLNGKGPFEALDNLHPAYIGQEGAKIRMEFERPDGRLRVKFYLNFAEERLEFEVHDGVFGPPDDGSVIFATHKAELTEFVKWYYLNGQLQVSDAETGELIARKDEFIPTNVIAIPEEFDKDIAFWRSIADSRTQLLAEKGTSE